MHKPPSDTLPPTLAEEERDLFFGVINRFVGLFSRQATVASQNDPSREYPFVAMDSRQVLAQLRLVRELLPDRDEPVRFLDVGCGIGNVLLFAEQLGFDPFGLEKDPYPCRIARQLFGEERIWQEDIWSFGRYHLFPVIYYFRPFADREPQLRFERLIEESLQPGGILIANHKNSGRIDSDQRFARPRRELPVWQKVSA